MQMTLRRLLERSTDFKFTSVEQPQPLIENPVYEFIETPATSCIL